MSTFWSNQSSKHKDDDDDSDSAHQLDVLPQYNNSNDPHDVAVRRSSSNTGLRESGTNATSLDGANNNHNNNGASTTKQPTAKVKALDGLRGIACFLVFNYHFLWPWTPLIMLGWGARPPLSPEPLTASLFQLPILCLLHRGRPMVAIFFAISGYVLARHVQRDALARRLADAYAKLASAVVRRAWRLYLPCAVSMAAVAVLAQVGVFREEDAIFMGPDSAWINGTVTHAWLANGTACPNTTYEVEGRRGVAGVLGLGTEVWLNETILDEDVLCVNVTSQMKMPALLYLDEVKPKKSATAEKNATATKSPFTDFAEYHHEDPHNPASKASGASTTAALAAAANTPTPQNYTWIQLGGSWEEHPIIQPHVFKAVANFTVVYAEWANPFQFAHMHPRYDPHTWTIPKELRGSMLLYVFLLGTAALQARWRLSLAAGLAAYALMLGFWDMGVFLGGMLHSEIDLLRATDPATLSRDDRLFVTTTAASLFGGGGGGGAGIGTKKARVARWAAIFAALYLLSYPDTAAEFTPGFRTLAALAPRWYAPGSRWMFHQAIGALVLLPCVLRSPTLSRMLESALPQYLGRISFSFYLVHGPVLHSLGFWVMPRLFERLGRTGGYVVGYVGLVAVALWVSGWFYRRVDVWSVGVGRRVERVLKNS